MNTSVDDVGVSAAINEMLRCPDDDPTVPRVGASAVRNGEVIAKGHRGEAGHAEYGLLTGILRDADLSSTVMYTTLEPCTFRGVDHLMQPKHSCTKLIIEARVPHVVIGMLDPNPYILGNGVVSLREHGIDVSFFSPAEMKRVEDANVSFRRTHRLASGPESLGQESLYIGRWIAETTFSDGTHTTEDVFFQHQIGNRVYGVMLNNALGVKYDFFMTRITEDVWDYSFRSKLRSGPLDHGAGMLFFDTAASARGYGVAHGAFAKSLRAPINAIVAIRRS